VEQDVSDGLKRGDAKGSAQLSGGGSSGSVVHRRLQSPDDIGQSSSYFLSGINCRCGVPAVKKTVTKDGANKGKKFWTCGESKGKHCNFFMWQAVSDLSKIMNKVFFYNGSVQLSSGKPLIYIDIELRISSVRPLMLSVRETAYQTKDEWSATMKLI